MIIKLINSIYSIFILYLNFIIKLYINRNIIVFLLLIFLIEIKFENILL